MFGRGGFRGWSGGWERGAKRERDIQQTEQEILSSYNLLFVPPRYYGPGSTLQNFVYSDVQFSALSNDSAQALIAQEF